MHDPPGAAVGAAEKILKADSNLYGPKLLWSAVATSPAGREEPLFVSHRAAPACSYGNISSGVARGWIHVAARAALSPSERARGRSSRLRQSDLSCAPAPSSPGATLYAAHRRRLARGGSHHAAARQPKGGEGVRAEARRLDRGAAQALAGGGAVRARG